MDIKRFFDLSYQKDIERDGHVLKAGFHYLIQQSELDGDYGTIVLRIVAQLSNPMELHCIFFETCGQSEDVLFAIRTVELQYFLSSILPLFNPLNRLKNEVPFPSPSESQNP